MGQKNVDERSVDDFVNAYENIKVRYIESQLWWKLRVLIWNIDVQCKG